MRKVKQRVRLSRLFSTGLCGALAACGSGGGGGSDDSAAAAYLVAALPFNLPGSPPKPALDLSNPDAVLAAALTAVSAARSIAVGDINGYDRGAPSPGGTADICDSGTVTEQIDEMGGVRTLILTSDQCAIGAAATVFDGPFRLSYSRPSLGNVQGELDLGIGAEPMVTGRPQRTGPGLNFEQQLGRVAFEGRFSGLTGTSVANGVSLIVGAGPLPADNATLIPDRQLEALAGTAATGFTVGLAAQDVTSATYSMAGPLTLAGSGAGLSPACAFAASFEVATNTAVRIDLIEDVARAGLLTLSTEAGSATVAFDASGNAQVGTGVGVPQTYPASMVQSFCGF